MRKFLAYIRFVVFGREADYEIMLGSNFSEKERDEMAHIEETPFGAKLVSRDGTVIATYSRARDARRGAARRGLILA